MGEIEEYFDMKGRQGGSSSVDHEAEDVESVSSSNFILGSFGRQRSDHRYDYPRAPSPMHFTHLNSPSPASNSYFMPSPLRIADTNKPRRRRRRRCRCLVFCCCCCLFSLLVTAILVALVTWLVLRPIHLPRFSVENLEFETLEFASDDSGLSATAFFTIAAENRNKRLGFTYDAIGVETSYRGRVFGHGQVPAFSLGHRNVTTLSSELRVENYSLSSPGALGQEFSNDLELERVEILVRANAKVRLKNTPFPVFKVFVNCDVAVKPPGGSSPSSLLSKTCKLTR